MQPSLSHLRAGRPFGEQGVQPTRFTDGEMEPWRNFSKAAQCLLWIWEGQARPGSAVVLELSEPNRFAP